MSPTTRVPKSEEQAIIRIDCATVDDYKIFSHHIIELLLNGCPPNNDDSTVASRLTLVGMF
ncbi:MAG: hypothetical protein GY928_16860 [Colwellia sp.]|nr:hypothetical protein [Colwellia sp.]